MVFILSSVFSNIQANNINSEDIKVSGVVQDQTGVELPGVSISVKGMDKGTITNASGEFSIMVPDVYKRQGWSSIFIVQSVGRWC